MIAECLVTEVEIEGDDCPLASASEAASVPIDARPPQLRADGNVLLRFSAPASEALRSALDADEAIRYLHVVQGDGTDSYRCLSKHPCVVHDLVNAGFLVDSMRYRDGAASIRGAVVGYDVLEGVMEAAGERVGITLTHVEPLETDEDEPVGPGYVLTPAQEESIRVAVEMGYFDQPRETTAAAVAEEMGISKSAFLGRLRRAQGALFGHLYG